MSPARRAFVMVWDGMRPDLISPELTPSLWRFVERGTRFLDSHAVFPTVTRVNSASLSTGTLPARHGIVGNSLYAPLVDSRAPISVGDHRSLYALIESRGGRLLPVDTLADRIQAVGGRSVVVSSGSPGSAFLCHPRIRECPGDRLFNPAIMLPQGVERELVERFGTLPAPTIPNTALDRYLNRALTDYVLPELAPMLLVYWHTDPDKTQHHRGFGSPAALEAIRNADTHFGLALGAYDRLGLLDETVVAVVSDHGYAGTERHVHPHAPFAESLAAELEAGRLILSRNGCSLYANVADDDERLVRRVAQAFQAWTEGGNVLSGARGRPAEPGTLPLGLVGLDGDLAPDVLCALAWDDVPNLYGHAGRSFGLDPHYEASHGGASRWEINNTLVLAGPGIKAGLASTAPAGNLDLAPTLLHLLDLERPQGQHGRVLHEALEGGPDQASLEVRRRTIEAEQGGYRQQVQLSTVGATTYLDFGRAEREP